MAANNASMFYNTIAHAKNGGVSKSRALHLSKGDDWFEGTDGSDKVRGKGGDDILSTGKGNDRVMGGKGDDQINGGDGSDILEGGNGDDVIFGASQPISTYSPYFALDGVDDFSGAFTVLAPDDGDQMYGGNGNDTMTGGSGDDFMAGGNDDDLLYGGGGDDEMRGGHGDDILFGGDGDDILRGGHGDDQMSGGGGADTFAFGRKSGHDIITDLGAGDLLDFSDLRAFDLSAASTSDGDNLVITLGKNSSVTILDALAGGLSVADAIDDLSVVFA